MNSNEERTTSYTNKLKRQYQQQRIMSDRFTFVLKMLAHLGPTSSCIGSFPRQLIELITHPQYYRRWSKNINFIYCTTSSLKHLDPSSNVVLSAFWDCILFFHNYKSHSFGQFYYEDFELDRKFLPNPVVHMKFRHCHVCTYVMTISIQCWYQESQFPLHSVNNFVLNHQGIHCSGNTDFLTLLFEVANRKFHLGLNIELQQMAAFPHIPIPSAQKYVFLKQIFDALSIPFIKLLDREYDPYGILPVWSIEQKEDCPITGCKPPYPQFELQCGHTISLMSYKGLIFNHLQDTEAIRCPFCRHDLKLKTQAVESHIQTKFIDVHPSEMNGSRQERRIMDSEPIIRENMWLHNDAIHLL